MPFEATPGFDSAQAVDASAVGVTSAQPGDVAPLPGAGSGLERAGAWLAARVRALVAAPWPAATALRQRRCCAPLHGPARRLRPRCGWAAAGMAAQQLPGPRAAAAGCRSGLARCAPVRPAAAGHDAAGIRSVTRRGRRHGRRGHRALCSRLGAAAVRPDRPLRADSLDFLRRALRLARRSHRRQR